MQFSPGADSALDALSETLVTEITPAPQPAPIPAKDRVKVSTDKKNTWRIKVVTA